MISSEKYPSKRYVLLFYFILFYFVLFCFVLFCLIKNNNNLGKCEKSKVCDASQADRIVLFCNFSEKVPICRFSRGVCLLQLLLSNTVKCTIPQLIAQLEAKGKSNLVGVKTLSLNVSALFL